MAKNNVAAKNIIIVYTTRMGSAVDYGNVQAKVITINKKSFTVRPFSESREFDTPLETLPISGERCFYVGRWTHYVTVIKGLEEVQALHKEMYPEAKK